MSRAGGRRAGAVDSREGAKEKKAAQKQAAV